MAEEDEAEETSESPEEKAVEFSNAFTLRRITRETAYRLVRVVITYNNDSRPDSPREYEYWIPEDEYVYDKVEIGKKIQEQNKARSQNKSNSKSTSGAIKDPHRFRTQTP
jgi:hypothetical protein